LGKESSIWVGQSSPCPRILPPKLKSLLNKIHFKETSDFINEDKFTVNKNCKFF